MIHIKKINSSRISINCGYNIKVQDIIKKLPKYYWDREKKVWTLPITELNDLEEQLSNLNLEYEVEQMQEMCEITEFDDYLEFKFNYFVKDLDDIIERKHYEYDSSRKMWTTKMDLCLLTDKLREKKIPFLLHSVDKKETKKQRKPKITAVTS